MEFFIIIGVVLFGSYIYEKMKEDSYKKNAEMQNSVAVARDFNTLLDMIKYLLFDLNASFSEIEDENSIIIDVPLYIKYGKGNTVFEIEKDLTIHITTKVIIRYDFQESDIGLINSFIKETFENEKYSYRCVGNNTFIFDTCYNKSFYINAEVVEMNRIHERFLTKLLGYMHTMLE